VQYGIVPSLSGLFYYLSPAEGLPNAAEGDFIGLERIINQINKYSESLEGHPYSSLHWLGRRIRLLLDMRM
jgi:hypothetical protein